jgi:hypothetical protein
MPVPPELARDPAVAGPLGSLAFSVVRPRTPTLALRALRWHRDLLRLGVTVPLALAHDLGLLLACPNEQLEVGARANTDELLGARARGLPGVAEEYRALIGEIARSEAARRSGALQMPDDVVVVVLARLLGGVAQRCIVAPGYVSGVPLDAALVERVDDQLPELFRAAPREHDLAALRELVGARLYVLTVVDALDLDTLQLFGMLGGDAARGVITQVDLFSALGSPEAHDIVQFSLEILPSVLEAKARPGAATHAAHGYSGLARKGSLDSLVLTELAWDELELMRRIADDEVLYYAREQSHDEATRVHHFLIDASASMRGERATFARGMALAGAKKLLLTGEDVTFRFFDARLYEPHTARAGQLPVAYLLSFKGERGRNPARVFAQLDTVLDLGMRRDPRQPLVHLFTHSALYIPREIVARIAEKSKIAAVFILPSGGALDLDYLDLLDAHWVVDHKALENRSARAAEARRILDDVGAAPSADKLARSG